MSVVAASLPSLEQRERLFFLLMAVAIAVTVVSAFSLWLAAGISSFTSPWLVHVHAVSFMAWIALYVAQNTLVFRNDVARHRRLGRVGIGLGIWMVVVGLVLTPWTLAAHRSPPFFTPAYFLAMDWINIVVFGGLLAAALRLRRQTDWHRRLMLSATICVMAPACGRLLILTLDGFTTASLVGSQLAILAVAVVADLAIRGRVHNAYLWGAAALAGMGLAIEGLARLGPFESLAAQIAG
ncbi:MAG: hypothetical protein AB7O54_11165 [Pseudomonadales bacterium]